MVRKVQKETSGSHSAATGETLEEGTAPQRSYGY